MFLYGAVFTIEMFSHTIVDKTRSAPDVVLVAVDDDDDDVVFIWRIIHVNALMRLTILLWRNQRGEIGRQHI